MERSLGNEQLEVSWPMKIHKTLAALAAIGMLCACTTTPPAPPVPMGKSLGPCLFYFEKEGERWFLLLERESRNYAHGTFLAKMDFFLTGVDSRGNTVTWPVTNFIGGRDQTRIRINPPDNIKEIIGAALRSLRGVRMTRRGPE